MQGEGRLEPALGNKRSSTDFPPCPFFQRFSSMKREELEFCRGAVLGTRCEVLRVAFQRAACGITATRFGFFLIVFLLLVAF